MCMENTPPAAKWPLMAGTSEGVRPRLPLSRALSIISSNCPSLNLQCRHTGKFNASRESHVHRQRDLPQRSPHLDVFVFRRHLALLWRDVSISLHSPVEQKQRNASLSASRILRLVGKFSGFLRAYPNWLPPTQTIQTQTTSSSRVWTQSDARGVGWQAGTSSVSEAVHVPRSTNYFLGQYYFRKKQKRARRIKRSALLLSMCPMNSIPR